MKFLNFDFDICAILIYLIVLNSYFQIKRVNNLQNKFFLGMLFFGFLSPVMDIVAASLINHECAWLPVIASSTLLFLSGALSIFCLMLYILSMMESAHNMSLLNKIFLALPIFLIILVTTINPLTGWLFKYSMNFQNGEIIRTFSFGPLFFSISVFNNFYFVGTIIYVFAHRNIFNSSFRAVTYTVCAINLASEVLQLFCSDFFVLALSFSITTLMIFHSIERYGLVVNPVTGVAKREFLDSVFTKKLHNKHPFQLMLIRMVDYDHNSVNYGFETMEKLFTEYEKLFVSYTGIGNSFKLSNNCYALLFNAKAGYQGLQEMIYEDLKKPSIINNIEILCEFYVTTLAYPEHFEKKEALLGCIQYFDKMNSTHFGIIPFKELQVNDSVREKQIEVAIENGLRDGNFQVFYQPICTAKEKKFVSAEALLRLYDSELGYISPEEFIPISEKNGSIIKVGNLVLESVCRFIRNNNMEELGLEYIEMNLSTVQVLQRNFIEIIDEITGIYQVQSKYLCFEITETASNLAPAIFTKNLKLLNDRGYILALDDFGTGYGNLQRMVNSDFAIIKFDKQMTQQLSSGDQLKKVYKTLQAMIHTMGSKVVSEGVETQEQYEFIRDAGGTYIQGFYFSKPLPEQDFIQFLLEKKSSN